LQESPFIVGRPVTGKYFVHREEERRLLLALVDSKHLDANLKLFEQ
jgi:hypothetical protein